MFSLKSSYTPIHKPFFTSVLWQCWLGNKKGIQPVKTGRWFVGGVDLTGALYASQFQRSPPPPPPSLAPIKPRMETFRYQLTQVHLEKWPLKQIYIYMHNHFKRPFFTFIWVGHTWFCYSWDAFPEANQQNQCTHLQTNYTNDIRQWHKFSNNEFLQPSLNINNVPRTAANAGCLDISSSSNTLLSTYTSIFFVCSQQHDIITSPCSSVKSKDIEVKGELERSC